MWIAKEVLSWTMTLRIQQMIFLLFGSVVTSFQLEKKKILPSSINGKIEYEAWSAFRTSNGTKICYVSSETKFIYPQMKIDGCLYSTSPEGILDQQTNKVYSATLASLIHLRLTDSVLLLKVDRLALLQEEAANHFIEDKNDELKILGPFSAFYLQDCQEEQS